MKKVSILQLIASICLLIGSIINLLNLLIEIPFALYVCTGPLLLMSVILFGIVIVKQIKHFFAERMGFEGRTAQSRLPVDVCDRERPRGMFAKQTHRRC